MLRFFNILSYLRWAFFAYGAFLVFYESLKGDNTSLSEIGFGIFLIGIGFAIGSFSVEKDFSKGERKLFSKPKRFQFQKNYLLIIGLLSMVIGFFFISIKYINPSLELMRADQYTNLGNGCIALGFGILFELKQFYERYKEYNKLNS